jgi:hypothetical protein
VSSLENESFERADIPVRFIDAFVDRLDLAATGFSRVTAKATGRPGYTPGAISRSSRFTAPPIPACDNDDD